MENEVHAPKKVPESSNMWSSRATCGSWAQEGLQLLFSVQSRLPQLPVLESASYPSVLQQNAYVGVLRAEGAQSKEETC